MVLLHGTLDVHIHEATDLPLTAANQAAGLMKRVVCCNAGPTLVGSCDPYVCLDVGKTRRLRSPIIQSSHNPRWDQRATVYVADEADDITAEIKDADRVGAEFLGMATIPAKAIVGGQPYDQWLDLVDKAGQPVGCWERKKFTQAKLHISITFKPVGAKGKTGGLLNEVPHTYFPLRGGNKVTLYHDSVCTPGPVKGIQLGNGSLYSESSCWDDLYVAIKAAKRCKAYLIQPDCQLRKPVWMDVCGNTRSKNQGNVAPIMGMASAIGRSNVGEMYLPLLVLCCSEAYCA